MRTTWFTTRPMVAAIAVALLSGCNTLSGVGGTSEYSCKAPPGVRCESISGVYANAVKKNLPPQRQESPAAIPQSNERLPPRDGAVRAQPIALSLSSSPATDADAIAPLRSLRTPARILRLWFKPWEDMDGDLFDQGYIYVQVDGGRWMVEHAQRVIRHGFAPVRPPKSADAASARAAEASPARPALPAAQALPSGEVPRSEGSQPLSGSGAALSAPVDSE